MKKIYIISTILAVFICTSAVAEVVTTRRATPRQPAQTTPSFTAKPAASTRLANSIKTCTPYSESLNTTTLGMDFNFNIQIKGWVNDKCVIDFSAKSTGINKLFKSLYGVDASDAQVYTYEPVAKCAFTKQQLESVGDSILEEQARKNGGKMLKDPNEIDISSLSNMSSNDQALMDMIFRQGACNISNGSVNPIDINGLDILGF